MPFQPSYTPNYFSIDDILATQERVPCKFTQNVPNLGKLNPSVEEVDLNAGTTLELPIWLAMDISLGRQPIVAADLPKVYKEAYREILKADPCAVDLHKFGLYFYELGIYAKQFDRRGEVSDILQQTFQQRFRQLMDLANNVDADPLVFQKLDTLERGLFKRGHEARSKLKVWLNHSAAPMEAAEVVLNHKKRKRVHVEDLL